MTTTVTVKANHGWPVRVTHIDRSPDGQTRETISRVEPGMEGVHAIWDGRDLLIHEIQPHEENGSAPSTA
jgi:hypothetical protein